MFASSRGECSTNIPQIISNDTQRKSLINQVKFPPTFKIPLKIQKNHIIEISIVNFFINKTINNQKATKMNPV